MIQVYDLWVVITTYFIEYIILFFSICVKIYFIVFLINVTFCHLGREFLLPQNTHRLIRHFKRHHALPQKPLTKVRREVTGEILICKCCWKIVHYWHNDNYMDTLLFSSFVRLMKQWKIIFYIWCNLRVYRSYVTVQHFTEPITHLQIFTQFAKDFYSDIWNFQEVEIKYKSQVKIDSKI